MSFFDDFLQQMDAIGLLTELDQRTTYRIETIIKRIKSEAAADILNAANLLVDVRDRNATLPEDYLPFLEELRQLSSDAFRYDSASITPHPKAKSERQYQLSFAVNGENYLAKVFVYDEKTQHFTVMSIIYAANRSLIDRQQDGLFHLVTTVDANGGSHYYGVIYLTATQREQIIQLKLPRLPYVHAEAQVITRHQLNAWISQFEALQLLNHLDDQTRTDFIKTLDPSEIDDALSLLFKVPDLIFSFDTEYLSYGTLQERFAELLAQVAPATRGDLAPSDIVANRNTDDESNDYRPIYLSFIAQGKQYETKLEYFGDYVDVRSLIKVLNNALKDTGTSRQFYGVDSEDQGAIFLYITDEQAATIQERGLFKILPM